MPLAGAAWAEFWVEDYAAVILNAQKQPAPRYVHRPLESAARFRLALSFRRA